MDTSSTTASAPVAAPAVPSAAAPGATPAASPGVSLQSPCSAGWSSYPPAVPFESSGASPPAQLARPWRQVGITAPLNADEAPVKIEDKYVPAELCLPGQCSRRAIALRALGRSFHEFVVADSGNDGAYVPRCADARSVFARGAAGRHGVEAEDFCHGAYYSAAVGLVTPWGPEPLPPISFAIMPGLDGVLRLGLATLKDLEIDPYERIWDSMQQRASPPSQGVETPAFLGSCRVSLSVATLQEAGGQATEEPDVAVERLVELGPEMWTRRKKIPLGRSRWRRA